MNWIKSFFFLIISFSVYYVMGDFILRQIKTKMDKFGIKIIIGFFAVYFIGFLVGFPCQYLNTSWKVYKYLLIFLYCLLFIFMFLKNRKFLSKDFEIFKKEISKNILKILRDNWVLFVIVLIFSFLSATNSLQLLGMNYDDGYYVGKVVHLIGIDKIGLENYFNGSITSNMSLDISRILNTCDLTYAFFADVFNISPVFFLRMTIMIQHYILVFTSYKVFASLFVKKEYAQYALLPLLIFVFSAGMMSQSDKFIFHVASYDNWQNQSAIYYGGSIVRCMILPVILYLSSFLLEKFNVKLFILILVVSISFLSFSTIALQPLILFGGILIAIKLIITIKENTPNTMIRNLIFVISTAIIAFVLYKFTFKNFTYIPNYTKFINEYVPWKYALFRSDIFLPLAPFVLTAMLFIVKNHNKYIILTLEIVFLLFYVNTFVNFIALSSVYLFFVALRTLASIQLITCLLLGVLLVLLISKIQTMYSKALLIIISVFTIILVPLGINDYYNVIVSYDYQSSGMTKSGYRLNQITQNDQMMEDEYVVIGEYFNDLAYGNYSLLTPETITKGKEVLNMSGVNIASNRIQTFDYQGGGITNEELSKLRKYLRGKEQYSNVSNLFIKFKITYVMVIKEKVKEDLIYNGYKPVLNYSKKSKFSLLKKEY